MINLPIAECCILSLNLAFLLTIPTLGSLFDCIPGKDWCYETISDTSYNGHPLRRLLYNHQVYIQRAQYEDRMGWSLTC